MARLTQLAGPGPGHQAGGRRGHQGPEAGMTDPPQRDHPLRGLRVVAIIDDGPPLTTLTGILLWVGIDGEVAIRCDDGQDRYGWPCLDLQQAPGTYWQRDPGPW